MKPWVIFEELDFRQLTLLEVLSRAAGIKYDAKEYTCGDVVWYENSHNSILLTDRFSKKKLNLNFVILSFDQVIRQLNETLANK